jgi:hypothetical protein
MLAKRTEGSGRVCERYAPWDAMDADVQEGPDDSSEEKTCGDKDVLHRYCLARSGSTSSQSRWITTLWAS